MAQVARNLTDPVDGFLRDHQALIIDRATKFTVACALLLSAPRRKLSTIRCAGGPSRTRTCDRTDYESDALTS